MAKQKVEDFGKKIGGAKKDLWKKRGLTAEDLGDMNIIELAKHVTKNNIWKKPDYEKMVHEDGLPKEVAYFCKVVRDSIAVKPKLTGTNSFVAMDIEEAKGILKNYIEMVQSLEQDMKEIKTIQDIENYYSDVFKNKYLKPQTRGYYVTPVEKYELFIDNKLLKAAQKSLYAIRNDVKRKHFCYSEDELLLAPYTFVSVDSDTDAWEVDYNNRLYLKKRNSFSIQYYYVKDSTMSIEQAKKEYPVGSILICQNNTVLANGMNTLEETKEVWLKALKISEASKKKEPTQAKTKRKKNNKYVPKQLENIQRVGEPVRYGEQSVKPDDYLCVFQFRGGEFGNWLSENERIVNMNMAYDALADLSVLLNVDPQDIGLHGELSIAFGARGSGNALAHYEPDRQVINLTKMKGAGSLGHEWIHALDHKIAMVEGKPLDLMSNILWRYKDQFPAFEKLVESMKTKELSVEESLQLQITQVKQEIENFKRSFFDDLNLVLTGNSTSKPLNTSQKEQITTQLDALIQNLEHKTTTPYISKALQKLMKVSDEEYKKMEYTELKDFLKSIDTQFNTSQFSRNYNYYGSKMNTVYNSIRHLEEQKQSIKPLRVRTDFYKDALYFDRGKKEGYWTKSCEMLARAASAYLANKAEQMGIRNDYLLGHAKDSVKDPETNVIHYIYPRGEEMEQFGKAFEEFIMELKEREILHEPTHEFILGKPIPAKDLQTVVNVDHDIQPYQLREDERGQLGFVFGESFILDARAIKDMKRMSKEKFLETYTEYNEDDYWVTLEDIQLSTPEANRSY